MPATNRILLTRAFALSVLIFSAACGNVQAAATATVVATASGPDLGPVASPTDTFAPTEIPATSTPSSTNIPSVTITAVHGNLFIRRGPDLAFNPIGVLYEGMSANVIAHDVLDDWAQVVVPGSQNTGWISIQSRYSKVDGDISTLPEITPAIWPTAAYLRNCTNHQMLIRPGEVVLPARFSSPQNEAWFNPGTYWVFDLEISGEPQVMKVEIREGSSVDILDNGAGEHHKCE